MSTARKMILLFLGIFVLAGALVAYNVFFRDKVSQDPKQLFHQALIKNLSEEGVTCTVERTESGTTQQLAVQLDLASKTNAHSVLTVKTADTTIQTEEVVVKSGNYLRYTDFKTSATNPAGQKPDYSRILQKWIRADTTKRPELFELTALGGCIVPFAKLPTLSQSSLSRHIESDRVFAPDYATSELAELGKSKVRRYAVKIMPETYAAYMREVGKAYGLRLLDSLKTDDFAGKQPREAIFSVNPATGRLVHVQFTDETKTVTFEAFGRVPDIKAPDKVISNAEADKLVDL